MTPEQRREAREMLAAGMTQTAVASRFGVSQSAISFLAMSREGTAFVECLKRHNRQSVMRQDEVNFWRGMIAARRMVQEIGKRVRGN
jgi:predicted transcriptional regulator